MEAPNFKKQDLQDAFEQGRRHEYRPSFSPSFNRWYNEHILGGSKCKDCQNFENTVKGRRMCMSCEEFSNHLPIKNESHE